MAGDLSSEAANAAIVGLMRKVDAAAVEILMSGRDCAIGPMTLQQPDYFAPTPLHEPWTYAVEAKVGPVPADYVPPEGWRVVRHADWVKAGRPGLPNDIKTETNDG